MRILPASLLIITSLLSGCATMNSGGCEPVQTGEGPSYSEQFSLLRKEKSQKRPRNTAAMALKPIYRPKALIPPRFLNQGYTGVCEFIFDVDQTGKVINLDIYACSSPLLESPAQKAIEQWVYEAPMDNGKPVIAKGIMARMHTIIIDKRGKKCPLQEYPR